MESLSTAIWSVPKAIGLAFIPVFIRSMVVKRNGKLDNTQPRNESAQIESMPKHLQELTIRLKNCHLNQLETLGVYAGAVGIALAAGVPAPTLNRLTSWYLKCRLGYLLAYSAPQVANGVLRSLTFVGSMVSLIMIFGAAADAA